MNNTHFESIVEAFGGARDKNGRPLKMDSLIISQGDAVFRHEFQRSAQLNDLRSVSKPILSIALGIAMEQGLIVRGVPMTLDTFIWPFFEGKVAVSNKANRDRLARVTLRHLLTHTIGYDIGLMFSKDIADRDPNTLLEYIWNTDIAHEPGEHFVYSNAGPYLVSALIQDELGVHLSDWVDGLLFRRLGISEFNWKNYGRYCAASSGLQLSNPDLHKIGRLFVDGGRFERQQVAPAYWLEAMSEPHVQTPAMYDEARVFPKYAYGYGLWICKDGTYYCDGTDGQYLIVFPKSGIVVTTFGNQPDMKPITECLRTIKAEEAQHAGT